MKKFFFPILFLLISSGFCEAQHEYDIWYFGSQAGLDFNSGSPVNLTNGQVYTTEGSACISDSVGNLLFYTDGVTVWNKNHQQMVNGNGLHGGYSTSQSALILRQPGSDSLYYIFTVGEAGSFGLSYSVVNMSLQSGLGEVILKNSGLLQAITEKITAVPHSNGTDYWVIIHDLNNKDFYAYQFSATGVNATGVVSTIGKSHNWEIGCMKASHDGTKLAVGVQYGNFFQLLDFDKSTGAVSNPITIISPPTAFGPYGVEFAPNDSLLYGTAYSGPCVILQWDISSNDSATINASRVALDSSNASNIGSLQLASDGKIYMAKYGDMYLGVVNNPNVYGNGCNYVDNGFSIAPKSSQLGLPNIPPTWYKTSISNNPASAFMSSDTLICQKFCLDFFDQSGNNPLSWQWEFEGASPSSSTLQNPTQICYNAPGTYNVTLITGNGFGNDTLTLNDFVTVFETPSFPTISQNGYTLTSSPSYTYQWQLNSTDIQGATNQSYTILQTGFYTIVVEDSNGCKNSATVYVVISSVGEVIDPADIIISPNPSNGNFTIEGLDRLPGEEISVDVVNTLGQIIFSAVSSEWTPQGKEEINLCRDTKFCVSTGVYFVIVYSEKFFLQKKMVISH